LRLLNTITWMHSPRSSLAFITIGKPVTKPVTWWAAPVDIYNISNGNDLVDYPVKIELTPSWDGWGLDDFSRVTMYFTDIGGNPLYSWIEIWDYASKHAVVWVKLPLIRGYSIERIYMFYSATGRNPYPEYSDPGKVFSFADAFNSFTWNISKYNDNSLGDVGTAYADSSTYISPPASLYIKSYASCGEPPFDGLGIVVSKPASLPSGSYRLSFWLRLKGTYYRYTQGSGVLNLRIGGNTVYTYTLSLGAYESKTVDWFMVERDITIGNNPLIEFDLYSGDCVHTEVWVDDFIIRKYTSPEPTPVVYPSILYTPP